MSGAARPAGPFATAAAVRTLAALVVLALVATAWVGLGRRREGPDRQGHDSTPGSTVLGEQEAAGDDPDAFGGLPTAPEPERGVVLPLGGEGGLPDGWTAETGTWGRDATGLRLEQAPPTGPALAVTTIDALPWATVSLTAPAAGPGGGVVFAYAGPSDHFVVAVEGTTARLLRVDGGDETEVASEEVPPADPVLVALDVTGRNIAIHVGTTVLPSIQAPSPDAARRIGVRIEGGADPGPLRWDTIGVRPRVPMGDPLVATGEDVTELTPEEARTHLGP